MFQCAWVLYDSVDSLVPKMYDTQEQHRRSVLHNYLMKTTRPLAFWSCVSGLPNYSTIFANADNKIRERNGTR